MSKQEQDQVMQLLAEGKTIVSIAKTFKTSRQTIMRIRDGAREE